MLDLTNLKSASQIDVGGMFGDPQLDAIWRTVEQKLGAFELPDGTGGVNPGDRRAIFYVVQHFCTHRMLEIGTHIGASTIHAASALSLVEGTERSKLDSVDVADVNDAAARPWRRYGAALSPREMITRLGLDRIVRFIVQPAAKYLAACAETYDLIFLDGDHSEEAAYSEIGAALKLLNPGGALLLHDYFPDARPLWSDGMVCAGPQLAVRRLQQEEVAVRAMPLGALPWPTKYGSTVTSLAILARDD